MPSLCLFLAVSAAALFPSCSLSQYSAFVLRPCPRRRSSFSQKQDARTGCASSLSRREARKAALCSSRNDDESTSDARNSKAKKWERYKIWSDNDLNVDPQQQEDAIDSFLRGEYDRPYADDAPGPLPGLNPSETVDAALRALRDLDNPEPSHGAAVLLKFCAPLSRGERWGGGTRDDAWKEVLRGAITPTMFARRLRASEFSCLLDWEKLDVTEGYLVPTTRKELGLGMTVAFVNAAMFFGDGIEPLIIQFKLRKLGGVWLIDTAVLNKKEWFVEQENGETFGGM